VSGFIYYYYAEMSKYLCAECRGALERFATDKRSNLFSSFLSDEEKSFDEADTRRT
jgi:hypothetical protein